jgi:hypothetical protein
LINKLPFIGWFLSFIANVSLAVPFWLFWTHWGLGRLYFYQLPPVYFYIPFWDCVGLFLILGIFKGMLPTVISIHQTNTNEKKAKKTATATSKRPLGNARAV